MEDSDRRWMGAISDGVERLEVEGAIAGGGERYKMEGDSDLEGGDRRWRREIRGGEE